MHAMGKNDQYKKEERRRPRSKADFIRQIGIGPDLAKFLTDFTEKPEILFSLSSDRCQEIEYQMDDILSLFGK